MKKYIYLFQILHQPAISSKGAASGGRANAPLRPHLQLDRTEANEGVREGSSAAQHGGHHHRRAHAHARRVRVLG